MNIFSVIDIETTGFAHNNGDRIIEIGIVKIREDGQIVDSFETLVNPDRNCGAVHIHGISSEMVSRAPRFIEIAHNLVSFLEGTCPVAHNADFDIPFINSELKRAGFDYCLKGLCTLKMARQLLPTLPSRSLAYLTRYFDISNIKLHCAYSDALAAARLLMIFLEKYDYRIQPGSMTLCGSICSGMPDNGAAVKMVKRSDLLLSGSDY